MPEEPVTTNRKKQSLIEQQRQQAINLRNEKLMQKKFRFGMKKYFVRMLNQQYWTYFEALKNCTDTDLKKVIELYKDNYRDLYNDATSFIVSLP